MLFERISGLPVGRAPGAVDTGDFRAQVASFPAYLTPELAVGLDRAAREFLNAHGIHPEPVTWQPPLALLADLELPGPDPAGVDIAALHQAIRQPRATLTAAAERLGTTLDTVRHLLERHPAPSPPTDRHTLAAARAALPETELIELYQRQRLSLHQIGRRVGVSRQTITRLADDYGITVHPSRRPRADVDRDWLHQQYVIRRRTLPELARETGMSPPNLARWARTHHIPLRARGGASHHSALRAAGQARRAPAVLRAALTSPYAWQRLVRFADAATYPTLQQAAEHLGINQPILITQINRLEHDLGQPLLERAERGRRMNLTPLGAQVAAAVRQMPFTEPPGSLRAAERPEGRITTISTRRRRAR